MKLKIIGSSSEGNGYIIFDNNEALILECGLPLMEVKKALDFNIERVKGLFVTHRHLDHCKYLKDYIKYFNCYSNDEVFESNKLENHYNSNVVEANKVYEVGSFRVVPFDLFHDVKTFGFLINHSTIGNTLFVTDTSELPYKFDNLTNCIIECNFEESILDQNYYEGKIKKFLYDRIKDSHLSLEKLKEFLLRTDLSKVNNIILCHLSDKNSNAKIFIEEIQRATGKIITVADKNVEIELNNF